MLSTALVLRTAPGPPCLRNFLDYRSALLPMFFLSFHQLRLHLNSGHSKCPKNAMSTPPALLCLFCRPKVFNLSYTTICNLCWFYCGLGCESIRERALIRLIGAAWAVFNTYLTIYHSLFFIMSNRGCLYPPLKDDP